MGRLRYGMLVSLDGYASDTSGSFDWAQPCDEPDAAPEHRDFASMWRAADKVIVSSTMTAPLEPRTELWDHLDLDRLATLVHESPTDVSIGGPTLAAQALKAGLVDEVTAYLMPHLAGGGLPWLPQGINGSLALREHRNFEGGAVALTYDIHRSTS